MNGSRQLFSTENRTNLNSHDAQFLQPVIRQGLMAYTWMLNCEKIYDNSIVLVGKGGRTRMTLGLKYVYRYREELFNKLRGAFESNDEERLVREWHCAKPVIAS